MIGVWHISVIHFNDSYLVRGVVLRNPLPNIPFVNPWLKSALYVIKSYFCKPLALETIRLVFSDKTITTETDASGAFELVIEDDVMSNDLQVMRLDKVIPILQQYPIYFSKEASDLCVISDIDETIIESYTSNAFRRIKTTLFKSVEKRKVIDFTHQFYSLLQSKKARFFYVSRSESNLFQIISGFVTVNDLPQGAIFLTKYLSIGALIKNRKEQDFKYNQIAKIVSNSPNTKFVLIGDDSQYDPAIYLKISEEYKHQVLAVYIRQIKYDASSTLSSVISAYADNNMPLYIFKHNQQFSRSLVPFINDY